MSKGINLEHLDPETLPGDDFYQFVNGGWLKSVEIPSDRSSWGSFHELARITDQKVLALLEEELSILGPSKNKAARLFETGMNIHQIENAKLSALQDLIESIHSLKDHHELFPLLGKLSAEGYGAFVNFSVHPDLGNSRRYAAYLEAPQLGLPEREFYLQEDEKSQVIRDKYAHYIVQLLTQGGQYTIETAEGAASNILQLEKQLALHMMTKEERRQIDKLYNPYTYSELKNLFNQWDCDIFFQLAKIPAPTQIIVTEPAYFLFLNHFLHTPDLRVIKDYLIFLLIHFSSPFADTALEEAHFNLYSGTLEGIECMRPRKERLVKVINQSLGEELGQLFVEKHFPPEAKQTALEMTRDIVQAFRSRIMELEWMQADTKRYALEKLDSLKVKIGYPDIWKDFSALEILPCEKGGNYLDNLMAVARWKFKRDVSRIEQDVDLEEWFMPPQLVNAYYNPMFNEIVFPAGILQPPFFDWEADAAINYGAIGAVIGHEITHGFDDQGSRFDKTGNLHEWWTGEDREKFMNLTQKLVDQFNAYYPFDDLALNGAFTLGENIADLGGLSVAFDALQLYFQRHGKPGCIDGYSAEQRFFMSWATVWRTKIRPEALRNQIKTDPHPPGMYRAVAAPSNMDWFYRAFDILPASQWYRKPEERIKIW